MVRGYRLADEEVSIAQVHDTTTAGLIVWLSSQIPVCLQEAEDEAILRQFEFLSIEQAGRRAPRVSLQRKRRLLICECGQT